MKVLEKNEKNKGEISALSVAKYLLSLDRERKYFINKKMKNKTNLSSVIKGSFRLNQMLYLIQIFHYLEYDQLLFKDNLYAWEHGVVVYSVYTRFWSLYFDINDKEIADIKDPKIKEFIAKCFNYLKNVSDKTLQEFSYNDPARASTWAKSSRPDIHFTDKENLSFYQQFCSRWLPS